MDTAGWLESTPRNLRLSVRTLSKSPAFTATVVLTLALGIGANSAVFSAIDAILLRPLPFPEADQLVDLVQHNPKSAETFVAPVRLEEWNRLNSMFQAISGYYSEDDSEVSGILPEKLKRALVAPRFLQVLGISPSVGRGFSPQEEHFGGPNAILISDRLWNRRFGHDPGAIGKTIRLGAVSYPVVGVLPASFSFPDSDVDLWSPNPMDAPYAQGRQLTWFTGIGRMKPGVTVAQARANMAAVQADLGRQFGKFDADLGVTLQPLKEKIVGGVRGSLWVLFAAVSVLLAIACTNIVALLLSRAAQRGQEISVRRALGASRGSLVNQLLTETFVLALAGATLGLFVAAGASRVFHSLAARLPRLDEVGLDSRIVLYSLTVGVLVTLVSGLLPALRGTRGGLSGAIGQGGRTQIARHGIQWVLVGVQVALAVTLLAGAGLLLRTFQELGRVTPGFEMDRVLTFQISTGWGETGDMRALGQRTARTLEFLSSIPGIEASAMSIGVPGVLAGFQNEIKFVEERAESEGKIMADSRAVSSGYFETMRIPVLAGEICRDDRPGVVVNRSFANTYFAGIGVIGLHLPPAPNVNLPAREITGIVGDTPNMGSIALPVLPYISARERPNLAPFSWFARTAIPPG